MKPSNIKALWFKLVGGSSDGSLISHTPKNLSEIAQMIREAKEHLVDSDTRLIEMVFVGKDGLKELVNLYKDEAVSAKEEYLNADVDPYKWAYYA